MFMVGMDEKEEAAGRPATIVTGTEIGLCLSLPSAFAVAVAADAWLLFITNIVLFVHVGGGRGVKSCEEAVCVMMARQGRSDGGP